jgi:hypothetical protein
MLKTYIKAIAAIIPIFFGASLRADNIVTNPGFETGDLTGWTLSGAHSSAPENGVYYGVDFADAHAGAYGAYFGAVGGTQTLSQSLTTSPGTSYTVSFWLAQAPDTPAGYVNSVTVSFGGTTLLSQTGLGQIPFSQYSFDGLATSALTVLAFSFRDDTGFYSLDDISVATGPASSVPEPATSLLGAPVLGLLSWVVYRGARCA